ncbi:MAG: 4-(cytidine 5'-diphospho)-2-C-methyl-D-erythritol kinase [Acidothermales bacterium]|nr:4-(cytidine 5'-diphospho)-2-C-methyl-D-erythritol kinase [Acidothermales bacterium]
MSGRSDNPVAVTARAPGKVNLQLSVGARGSDGYHDLVNVFHAVALYDEVTAYPADRLTLTVSGEGARTVPADDRNLAARAAQALAARTARTPRVRLHVQKAIPVAAGMAGGSADAAAALVACDALWCTGMRRSDLLELAAGLGSDVPFALVGGTAVGIGRGDLLTPAMARGEYHWVLAFATGGLSTPAVYAELDRIRSRRVLPEPGLSPPLMAALRASDVRGVGAALSNDMQVAALTLRPALRRTLEAGREHGALGAMVCGSGPTCAFLARDEEAAVDLAVALSGSGVCRIVRRVRGPAPGARLVEDAAGG